MEIPIDFGSSSIALVIVKKEEYRSSLPQMISSLSSSSSKTAYVCINSPYNFVSGMVKKLGLEKEKFFFIDTVTRNVQEPPKADDCIFVSSPNALTEISLAISKALNEKKCDALFFDTLSALLIYENAHSIIHFTHSILTKLQISSGKAVFIALKEDLNSELVKDLYMFVDKVIDLTEQKAA